MRAKGQRKGTFSLFLDDSILLLLFLAIRVPSSCAFGLQDLRQRYHRFVLKPFTQTGSNPIGSLDSPALRLKLKHIIRSPGSTDHVTQILLPREPTFIIGLFLWRALRLCLHPRVQFSLFLSIKSFAYPPLQCTLVPVNPGDRYSRYFPLGQS